MRISRLFHKSLALALLSPAVASAIVGIGSEGRWPTNWPKELEPFRSQAKTIEVANGIQENVYEIRFTNRVEFERVWPVILQLKTPGAPITLYSTNNPSTTFFNNDQAAVRIYAPCGGWAGNTMTNKVEIRDGKVANQAELLKEREELIKEGRLLNASPPWPSEIISANGELPEYVVAKEENGISRWISGDPENLNKNKAIGFHYRARVDLELVVDGQVIDLNSIHLPDATPIHDKRAGK